MTAASGSYADMSMKGRRRHRELLSKTTYLPLACTTSDANWMIVGERRGRTVRPLGSTERCLQRLTDTE